MTTRTPWTPNQLRVIRELLEWDDELMPLQGPTHVRDGLRDDLTAELEELTRGAAALFADHDESLSINKFDLARVHKCEGLYVATDEFQWTVKKARGRVVHRGIQKSLAGRFRQMPPLELARETVESMIAGSEDSDFGDYLSKLDSSSMGELLTESGSLLAAFASDWPPIRPSMHPRIEPTMQAWLHGGLVAIKGRFDLALGPPGRGPVVIVDFKTGAKAPEHRDEMRYYALLETLRNGVPPIRVATYYLDGGWEPPEEVNEGVLRSAVRRTGVGVDQIARLWWREHAPVLSPGWHCRYCPLKQDCAVGSRWLHENVGRFEP